MYRKMLVPLDGSEFAEVVFPYVKGLAGKLDLEVVLLHVSDVDEREFAPMDRAYLEHVGEDIRRDSRSIQQRAVSGTAGKPVEVRGELVVGYSAEGILHYAHENTVDFIIIATQRQSGIRHWELGKVTDKVLRAANVPVLLVRAGISDETPYDKWPKVTILVPLDGSVLAESVLPHVETMAKQRGPEPLDVVLLRVCEPPAMPSYYAPDISAVPLNWGEYMQQETAKCNEAAKTYLDGVENRLKNSGIADVRSEIVVGKAVDAIINFVNKNPFTLIVMATHGRSGLSRWVYGSVAESVLLGVTKPIFLVRAPSANA